METKRCYEFGDSKFWEVTVEGDRTLISYGAMGAAPRSSSKAHADEAAALKFAEKKIKEKTKKGYTLVAKNEQATEDKNEQAAEDTTADKEVSCDSLVARKRAPSPAREEAQKRAKTVSEEVKRYEFGNPPTKFWEISVDGNTTLIGYGSIGSKPRPSNATHKDEATAIKFAEKKIKEKLGKGYTLVVDGVKPAAVPAIGGGTGPLVDGETREVQGSGVNPYQVSRKGNVYSCSCPGWRFQKTNIAFRTCKHLKGIMGDAVELERVGGATAAAKASAAAKLPFAGSVMLANSYVPERHQESLSSGGTLQSVHCGDAHFLYKFLTSSMPTDADWWMSEKLDGLRAVWDGTTFVSRTGNPFDAPKEFTEGFPSDMVLDGELFCGRGNFDKASSLVRSMGGSYDQWDGSVTYEVFDAPLLQEPFEGRMKTLESVIGPLRHANLVTQELVRDANHLQEKLASIEADDGEGLMLRKKGSGYEFRRSDLLLKVKTMDDAEAEVIGHEEGKGKHTGRCGALLCVLPSGKKFKVGSGLTDAQRNKPPPIGSTITFGYFELTKGGVPRFPTFKRIYKED